MMGMDEATSARVRRRLGRCKTTGPQRERDGDHVHGRRSMTKAKKAKKVKKPKAQPPPPQPSGRIGAEQWLAVRLKSGAGPMEPKPRRGTRAERERAALELDDGARDGKEL
jgi:hypothetical protein